jgi:hypothetical protein
VPRRPVPKTHHGVELLPVDVDADKNGPTISWASALGGGLRPKLLWVRVSRIVALHHACRGNLRIDFYASLKSYESNVH